MFSKTNEAKYKERLKNSSYHRKSILTHEYGHANDFNNPGGKLCENKDVIKLYNSFDKWFKDNDVGLRIISGDSANSLKSIAHEVGLEDPDKVIALEGLSEEEVAKFPVWNRYVKSCDEYE